MSRAAAAAGKPGSLPGALSSSRAAIDRGRELILSFVPELFHSSRYNTAMDAFFLDLNLTVTAGTYDTVGGLRLFCWIKAVRLGAERPARGRLVALHSSAGRGLVPSERELMPRELKSLVAHLHELRFPEAKPRVEGVFDTSDVWEHVVLRVALNDDTDTLELSLCASGFEGEDAGALRAAFGALLAAAGVLEEGDWFNLTGTAHAQGHNQPKVPALSRP